MAATNKNWLNNPVTAVLAALVLISVVVYLGVATNNEIKQGRYIGPSQSQRDTITIDGEGKVTAVPDIGQITVSIVTNDKDVTKAQNTNISQFNALVAALTASGIDKKDLTTSNYNLGPVYDWSTGKQVFQYYQVTQSLLVKIRDLSKSGNVIQIASQNGVNQVSDLSFTIDDPEKLREQARQLAIQNAQQKAQALADEAGVHLGKIVSFSESPNQPVPGPIPYMAMDKAMSGGVAQAPTIEAGSQDVIVDATIQYEIY